MSNSSKFVDELEAGLVERDESGLLRTLQSNQGIDFTSNDYLGYSQCPQLKDAVKQAVDSLGVGFSASRLLRGNHTFIEQTEQALADFSNRQAALIFSSGFAANIGLLRALTQPGDMLFSDELNHASIIDGIKLSNASKKIFRHQDFSHLEHLLKTETYTRAFIITESVFSMDGDLTDLSKLCDLARTYDAQVIVDEAHATGIYGENGSGRVEELGLAASVLCTMHTGGKALGVGGAWIASDRPVISHLINHARSFVFSTAPVPALIAGLQAAIEKRRRDQHCAEKLLELAASFRSELRQAGFNLGKSESQIIPVILGDTSKALTIAEALQKDGFDIRAIRPPTVPEGTSRLRITLRSNINPADLQSLQQRLTFHAESLKT